MAGYIKTDTALVKLKSAFIGNSSNVAKKIKKAYIGDNNNIAQLIWSGGDGGLDSVSYYGTATSLSSSRAYMGAASNSNYLIFAGGVKNSSYYPSTDAYDANLTHSTITRITSRAKMGSASLNGCAFFAGGQRGLSSFTNVVEGYTSTNTQFTIDDLDSSRGDLAGAATENFMYFAGGYNVESSIYKCTDLVDVYDSNYTHSTSWIGGSGRSHIASVSTPEYAFFAGGEFYEWEDLSASEREWTYENDIDIFDNNGTSVSSPNLAERKSGMAGACAGEYVVFTGGYRNNGTTSSNFREYYYDTAEIIDANLTKITGVTCYIGVNDLAAASLGRCVIFAGGTDGDAYHGLDVIDEERVSWAVDTVISEPDTSVTLMGSTYILSEARWGLAAGTVGNYALFAGGIIADSEYSSAVDVVQME